MGETASVAALGVGVLAAAVALALAVASLVRWRRYPEAVLFSAQTGEGLDDLVDRIAREAAATDVLLSADIPYREGALITLVHEQGTLLHEEYLEDGVRIVAKLPARIAPRLKRYRTE